MNEHSKNVVRRRHIGKNHTTLGPEYFFFRTSAPARIFRPWPAVSGGIFGRDLGHEKKFPAPCGIIYYRYNALWAMNERAQERCRRVTCTCHVGWKLPIEIPQSSTLKHPIQAKTLKRVGVCNCTRALTPQLLCRSHISYRSLLM